MIPLMGDPGGGGCTVTPLGPWTTSLCMLSGPRALFIALCLQVHTNGGKPGYIIYTQVSRHLYAHIYSSGRPHGPLVCLACREDWSYIYIDGLYSRVPDSYVKYSVINGPTDGL